MDKEYHYYITFIIALRAGFKKDEAYKIAYSSQYTDDNDTPYEINEGQDDAYENYISQTENITKPQEERLRIYTIFHFMPGTPDEIWRVSLDRKDGKLHLLNTIPNNQNAAALLRDALKSGNFYWIGIATHMFADTFAHQNFVGFKDEFNAMEGFLEGLLPNIGHAEAKYQPDIPNLRWKDERLTSKYKARHNRSIFLEATGCIFDQYCSLTKPPQPEALKKALLDDIGNAIGKEADKDTNALRSQRQKRYKGLLKKNYVEYKKKSWFNEAIRYERDPLTVGVSNTEALLFWKEGFKNSDWYLFQEAVKEHQRKAKEILNPTFERMEVAKLSNW
ncbi:MAG: hypothetical protein HY756_02530 [Nitrospirae bacterium]|nr:hypothetical protein [Nitrospirota bacterium]